MKTGRLEGRKALIKSHGDAETSFEILVLSPRLYTSTHISDTTARYQRAESESYPHVQTEIGIRWAVMYSLLHSVAAQPLMMMS